MDRYAITFTVQAKNEEEAAEKAEKIRRFLLAENVYITPRVLPARQEDIEHE